MTGPNKPRAAQANPLATEGPKGAANAATGPGRPAPRPALGRPRGRARCDVPRGEAARRRCATATPCPAPAGSETTLLLMPAWRAGAHTGVKIVHVAPANAARGEPAVHAAYLLSDALTGAPLALMDGGELTDRRTAAASLLAARHLAPARQRAAAGPRQRQGGPRLAEGYAARFPIADIAIWSPTAANAERLARSLAGMACRRARPPRPTRPGRTSSPRPRCPRRRWSAGRICARGCMSIWSAPIAATCANATARRWPARPWWSIPAPAPWPRPTTSSRPSPRAPSPEVRDHRRPRRAVPGNPSRASQPGGDHRLQVGRLGRRGPGRGRRRLSPRAGRLNPAPVRDRLKSPAPARPSAAGAGHRAPGRPRPAPGRRPHRHSGRSHAAPCHRPRAR